MVIHAYMSRGTSKSTRVTAPVAELAKLSEALKVLGLAQRPVIVCGQGVLLSQAWGEVQVLAELFGVPVGTTINGKGALSRRITHSASASPAPGAEQLSATR